MRLTRCAGLRCRGDVTRDGGARACLGVARVATEAAFLPSVFGFSSGKFSHTKNPSKHPPPKKSKYPPGVWREKPLHRWEGNPGCVAIRANPCGPLPQYQ